MASSERATLVLLHGLGCSASTWRLVAAQLGDEFDCVALDLPGHGDAAGSDALTVEQAVDAVIAAIEERGPRHWALVGHSMGGKIAALVAARTERGRTRLPAPVALVLVAASPLTPEPMDDAVRAEMIGWCDPGPIGVDNARSFVDANTARRLPAERRDAAAAHVRRVDPAAWQAWLERGSREDWTSAGPVHVPTLVVAGAKDGPLGPGGQREFVLPHVAADEVTIVEDAAHLLMLERPAALTHLIRGHVTSLLGPLHGLPAPFVELLLSDRVSARTRGVLLGRLAPSRPDLLDQGQRVTLAALLAAVLPQRGTDIDLPAAIEAELAGPGDGWRFAELPPDLSAWRVGLDALAAHDFANLPAPRQRAMLQRMDSGEFESAQFTGTQAASWLEDVRAAAARVYLAHPAAHARLGYDGFATGGDGDRKTGFLRLGPDEREHWQTAGATS